MVDITDEQHAWVASFLGIDTKNYDAQTLADQGSTGDNTLVQKFSSSDMNTLTSLGLDAVALSSYPCLWRAARYAGAAVAVTGTCGISLPAVILGETPPTALIAAASIAGCIGSLATLIDSGFAWSKCLSENGKPAEAVKIAEETKKLKERVEEMEKWIEEQKKKVMPAP